MKGRVCSIPRRFWDLFLMFVKKGRRKKKKENPRTTFLNTAMVGNLSQFLGASNFYSRNSSL